MTTKYIILDAWRSNFVSVSAVQGETAARFLDVTLTGNGTAINLSDKTVAIYYKKPDGTTIFNSGTIKDATAGLVEIPLTSQMSVLAGEMQDVEIRVTQTGGGTLKIKGLRITIEAAESYDSAVESTDEYTALESALANVTAMTSHMDNKNNPHAVTAAQLGAVPTTRKVNGKVLSGDITLDASDIGDAVPTTRTVNGKPLSGDITLTPADISGISESGSNSNGSYVKLYDGTLLCWKTLTIDSAAITTAWGTWYQSANYAVGNFAAPFFSIPICTISEVSDTVGAGSCVPFFTGSPTTAAFPSASAIRPTGATIKLCFHCMAVGRWKA